MRAERGPMFTVSFPHLQAHTTHRPDITHPTHHTPPPSHTQAHTHSRKIHFPQESWLWHAPARSEPRVPAPHHRGASLLPPSPTTHHPAGKAYNSPTLCCVPSIAVLSPRCSNLNVTSLSQIPPLSTYRFIWGRNAELLVFIHPIYGLFILVHILTVFCKLLCSFCWV